MDLDRFVAVNSPLWSRLDSLVRKGRGGKRNLSAEELDELVAAYQRVSTHLSIVRTTYRDPALVTQLTGLVARSGTLIYGTRALTWRAPLRFIADTFPAAVWHSRWFVAASFALFMVPAVAVALWLSSSPAALDVAAPPALREAYLEEDFEAYYSSAPAAEFAAQVTTNNIQVAIFAFAGGIAFCLLTAYILLTNGANVGFAAGVFAAAGQQGKFYGLILPHGLLEITAVLIAGAAGLRLGWALVDPGDRRRSEALAEQGRRAIVIVVGLIAAFVVAGLIEGFVTGSRLPTWGRVGTGVVVELAFLVYIVTRGRAAAARGLTGRLGEQSEAGWARVS